MHPSPLTPESITEYILFNSEYSVIICRQCKCALVPGEGIKRHFQNLHQAISLQIRKQIIAYCDTLTLLPTADVITPNNIFPALYPLKPAYSGGVASVIYASILAGFIPFC